jgi:single-stranded-DNA-specific exonuclease
MWPLRPVDETGAARLAEAAHTSPTLARLLWLRGVRDADGARRWLAPTLSDLHPPELLPDFGPAVERIRRAITAGERILVWGHDDLDGITSIVVLHRVITDLRGRASYYVPAKGRERHGLNPSLALKQRDNGVGLVITVDCGITNQEQIAELGQQGMDVIVTDHHEVIGQLPSAVANVDPKRPDSTYPFRGLAGVGVALKLAMGLVQETVGVSPPEFASVQPQLMALAVLGTLADRVPLVNENRTLVAACMRQLEQTTLPAVRVVLDHLASGRKLTPARLVIELLPLFASANGNEGVEKILEARPDEARNWVADLEMRSVEWRAEAERTFGEAQRVAVAGDGVVFARGRELSLRALGFCAARLKERYQLPAIVMGWRGDAWVGECRGLDGVSLIDILVANSRYLTDYGGHSKAAGFSVSDENVAAFVRDAEQFAHEHFAGKVEPENVVQADALLPLREFSAEFARLAPFGDGNRPPVFISGPSRLAPLGEGWAAEERPDLALRYVRQGAPTAHGTRAHLLYTMDDDGLPVLLEAAPVPNGS